MKLSKAKMQLVPDVGSYAIEKVKWIKENEVPFRLRTYYSLILRGFVRRELFYSEELFQVEKR